MLSYAEGVLVPKQDRAGFVKILSEVLAFDVDQPAARKDRLANVLAQRRARWLLKPPRRPFLFDPPIVILEALP